jgi:S1-C subfamily serine protease
MVALVRSRSGMTSGLLAALLALGAGARPARAGKRIDAAVAALSAQTGTAVVFTRDGLPDGAWFDVMRPLSAAQQREGLAILQQQAAMYPAGWLGDLGLAGLGVFAGLADTRDDGYRTYDEDLGGYPYYGVWNGADGIAMAFYTPGQLPLTFHHEVFHHVDEASGSSADDDARFAKAIAGTARYPALAVSAADLAALKARSDGAVLRGAVSDYAAKAAGEDQAETARYLMSNLPDALVQMATQPTLAGSQRLLHVVAQLEAADGPNVDGPDAAWLIDVALGRDAAAARAARTEAAARAYVVESLLASARAALAPSGAFVVRGAPVGTTGNPVLRRDILAIAATGRRLTSDELGLTADERRVAGAALLALAAEYRAFIAARWSISATTDATFAWVGADLARVTGAAPVAIVPAPTPTPTPAPAPTAAATPARTNPYLAKVDAEISDRTIRAAIRAVQAAAVRLGNGCSGVNLDPRGLVLTAGHCVDALGKRVNVAFPDGASSPGETIAFDDAHDLALIELDDDDDGGWPWARLAAAAPAVGTMVVAIGQPGTRTPDGEPTGYQPWHVSVGEIRGFRDGARTGEQGLGRTKHDAWTYWGHSGSPLFDQTGKIVALHNSWDSRTAMRHAVTWEAIGQFLDDADHAVAGR